MSPMQVARDRMFCPKCAGTLNRLPNGILECKRGRLAFSAELSARLAACYADRQRRPRDEPFGRGVSVGGTWFCPGCGVRLLEALQGDVRCPECQLALNEFLYALNELHPHYQTDGALG